MERQAGGTVRKANFNLFCEQAKDVVDEQYKLLIITKNTREQCFLNGPDSLLGYNLIVGGLQNWQGKCSDPFENWICKRAHQEEYTTNTMALISLTQAQNTHEESSLFPGKEKVWKLSKRCINMLLMIGKHASPPIESQV